MRINDQVVVFDAADLSAESSLWAALLGGTVDAEDDWHMVFVDGGWAFNTRLTTLRPTGLTERRSSRFTSTCGSMTSKRLTTRSSHSVPSF